MPALLILMWTAVAMAWPLKASDAQKRSGDRSEGWVSTGGMRRVNGFAKKAIALGLVVYVSSNAFAGRDGAQVLKQDSENKRVARERHETCELSGKKLGSQTMAHGQRLFSLPGECGSLSPHPH